MAGLNVISEVANVLVLGPPGLRADLVASMPDGTKQIIIDVRTADPCTAENVKRSAQVPGHAACQAKSSKTENGEITSTPRATSLSALLSKQEGLLVMVQDHFLT